ncbi:MAG: hypothetical protein N2040_08490 [Caldimonas manganoxidans]|nr:hypothetical protein [Caldimonas manganoxidans]
MLLQTAHTKRVEAAKAVGIDLKQTFAKEGQASASKASGNAHARQFKRMRRAIQRQRTIRPSPVGSSRRRRGSDRRH